MNRGGQRCSSCSSDSSNSWCLVENIEEKVREGYELSDNESITEADEVNVLLSDDDDNESDEESHIKSTSELQIEDIAEICSSENKKFEEELHEGDEGNEEVEEWKEMSNEGSEPPAESSTDLEVDEYWVVSRTDGREVLVEPLTHRPLDVSKIVSNLDLLSEHCKTPISHLIAYLNGSEFRAKNLIVIFVAFTALSGAIIGHFIGNSIAGSHQRLSSDTDQMVCHAMEKPLSGLQYRMKDNLVRKPSFDEESMLSSLWRSEPNFNQPTSTISWLLRSFLPQRSIHQKMDDWEQCDRRQYEQEKLMMHEAVERYKKLNAERRQKLYESNHTFHRLVCGLILNDGRPTDEGDIHSKPILDLYPKRPPRPSEYLLLISGKDFGFPSDCSVLEMCVEPSNISISEVAGQHEIDQPQFQNGEARNSKAHRWTVPLINTPILGTKRVVEKFFSEETWRNITKSFSKIPQIASEIARTSSILSTSSIGRTAENFRKAVTGVKGRLWLKWSKFGYGQANFMRKVENSLKKLIVPHLSEEVLQFAKRWAPDAPVMPTGLVPFYDFDEVFSGKVKKKTEQPQSIRLRSSVQDLLIVLNVSTIVCPRLQCTKCCWIYRPNFRIDRRVGSKRNVVDEACDENLTPNPCTQRIPPPSETITTAKPSDENSDWLFVRSRKRAAAHKILLKDRADNHGLRKKVNREKLEVAERKARNLRNGRIPQHAESDHTSEESLRSDETRANNLLLTDLNLVLDRNRRVDEDNRYESDRTVFGKHRKISGGFNWLERKKSERVGKREEKVRVKKEEGDWFLRRGRMRAKERSQSDANDDVGGTDWLFRRSKYREKKRGKKLNADVFNGRKNWLEERAKIREELRKKQNNDWEKFSDWFILRAELRREQRNENLKGDIGDLSNENSNRTSNWIFERSRRSEERAKKSKESLKDNRKHKIGKNIQGPPMRKMRS
ncbi:hypothetical protein AB6A40_003094 [Gnathostoma spinigerum]|uniref:Uncharacterized protein n=1 Tax=Gnathostoma spinigerum TaxID=75299 RepID=A0ABD6E8I2_9BILA